MSDSGIWLKFAWCEAYLWHIYEVHLLVLLMHV
jgi:hypothetical protein